MFEEKKAEPAAPAPLSQTEPLQSEPLVSEPMLSEPIVSEPVNTEPEPIKTETPEKLKTQKLPNLPKSSTKSSNAKGRNLGKPQNVRAIQSARSLPGTEQQQPKEPRQRVIRKGETYKMPKKKKTKKIDKTEEAIPVTGNVEPERQCFSSRSSLNFDRAARDLSSEDRLHFQE